MLRANGATRQRGPGLNGNRWSLDQLQSAAWSACGRRQLLLMSRANLSDEYRCEQREDECLNERNEDFQEHDEQRHWNRGDGNRPTEHEDQTDERENDHVPSDDVREESDRQGEGLRELPDDLDWRHDQRQQEPQ